MEPSDRLQYLFGKHLREESNEGEFEELIDLLNTGDADDLDFQMKELWDSQQPTSSYLKVDWQQILSNVISSDEPLPATQNKKSTISIKFWFGIAAAILIILSFTAIIFNRYADLKNAPIRLVQKSAPLNQINVIRLNDGSRVTLNAGSSLRYSKKFNGNLREVFLIGEGFFEVAHNPQKPFIVHAGQIKTQVLGTSFNISAFPASKTCKVTVVTGKVVVMETVSNKKAILLPNQQAVFNLKNKTFTSTSLKTNKQVLEWRRGKMAFDDVTILEIADEMFKRYGVHIKLGSPELAKVHMNITFNDDTLENMLTIISSLTNSNYRYEGRNVIFYLNN